MCPVMTRQLFAILLCVWGSAASLRAQVSDDFSDGDFTNNPSWDGNTTLWQVTNGELQSNGDGIKDTLYLSTAQSNLDDTEWRITARYTASGPSTSNRIRIYLAADQADLSGPLNGYFIQVGESGSTDSYDLYRQSGTTISRVIDGVDPLGGAGVDATLKVTRDNMGNWSLEVDQGNTGVFLPQGTGTDATHQTSSHMGVWVRLSSSRTQSYFFDNVYAGPPIQDLDPPTIAAVTVIDNQRIDVLFSEALAQMSAEATGNYTLDNGIGNPATATLDGTNIRLVHLVLNNALQPNTTYTLSVSNVADLSGNTLSSPITETFTYVEIANGERKDVIINEIMADFNPSQGLPEAEYVELYNRSTNTIDLAGWTIDNGTTVGTLPSFQLGPDEYVVLVRNTDASLFAAFPNVISPSAWTSLVNGGDNLGLRNAQATLIDSVSYELSWYRDGVKDDGGYSLELINPTQVDCAPAGNWIASTALIGGTPGTQNSVFSTAPDAQAPSLLSTFVQADDTLELCFSEGMDPGTLLNPASYTLDQGIGNPLEVLLADDNAQCVQLVLGSDLQVGQAYVLTVTNVTDCAGNPLPAGATISVARGVSPLAFEVVITELFPDFSPSVGLPEAEFVELYNRSNKVLDLSGFKLSDGSSEAELPNVNVLPGEYYIVCSLADTGLFNDFGKVIPVNSLPSLNNTTDSITLLGRFFETIDYVFYTSDWYGDPTRSAGGYTLERIDPDFVDCNNANNWRASSAVQGGTPGAINASLGIYVDTEAPSLANVQAVSESILLLTFSEPMDAGTLSAEENFLIDQGIGEPVRAISANADNRICRLDLSNPLVPNTLYQLSLQNLSDCNGNVLTDVAVFGLPVPAQPFDVIITELLPDPTPPVGLPEVEFVELFNRSSNILDLQSFTVGDNSNQVSLGPGIMAPGEYIIVTRAGDETAYQSFGKAIGVSGLPTLSNGGDTVLVRTASGELSDYVFYSDSWYQDLERSTGGYSLERIDLNYVDCNNAGNWIASPDPAGGTPGTQNAANGPFADNTSPSLISIRPLSRNEILLAFSEQMDPATLEDITAYSGNNNLGSPVIAQAIAPDFSRVRLTFTIDLDSQVIYQLEITGLSDCVGNVFSETVSLGLPEPAVAGDILMNEILFNPFTGGKDFLEIVNVSEKVLDLGVMQIGEIFEGTDSIFNADPVAEQTTLMLPGDIICLTADVALQEMTYLPPAGAKFLEMSGFPSYDDSDGEAVIFTNSGLVLDRFYYEDDYHFPTLDDDNGVSLERLSLKAPTQDPENWQSAASTVGYATPGYANSQFIVENPQDDEVYLEKQTFSPNGDGQDDVLTIRYKFNFAAANTRVFILNARGNIVRTLQQNVLLDPSEGTFFWDGTMDSQATASVGMYIVVVEAQNETSGRVQVFRRVAVLADRF